MGQHDGKGNKMHPGQRLRDAFVVTHQATEARHPGEPALDHPAPRQHDNALRGGRQRDHLQAHAVGGSLGCRVRTGVALVDEGHLHVLPVTSYMHAVSQRRHLRPVVFVGWG